MLEIDLRKKKKKKEKSEIKKKKIKGRKVINKEEDTPLGVEEEPKRQKASDKRYDKFKKKIVRITEK
ncbi:11395_t:CDS:2, partial [Gigaspora rosea]